MKRLYVLCEGQTEEDFIGIVLGPYLKGFGIITTPIICTTKRTSTRKYIGGVSNYSKIKKELMRLCGEHPNEMITTMFDFYALPRDTPDIDNYNVNIYKRVEHIEKAITESVGNRYGNVIVNLVLHEFEGLLFSDVSAFESIADKVTIEQMSNIRASFETPEHINDKPDTAPSKRIKKILPGYSKISDGIDIAELIGIDKISSECSHFRRWISKLTEWATGGCCD